MSLPFRHMRIKQSDAKTVACDHEDRHRHRRMVAGDAIADIIPKKAIKRTRLFFVICMKTLLSYALLMKMQYCRKVLTVLRETRRMQFSA